jgi:transposase
MESSKTASMIGIKTAAARIKQFRCIATRYDKLAKSFLSFVHLACAFTYI